MAHVHDLPLGVAFLVVAILVRDPRLKLYSYPEDVRAAAAKASADVRAATRSRVEATKASGGF